MTSPSSMRAALVAALLAPTLLFGGAQNARAGGAAIPVLDIDFNVESMFLDGVAEMPLGPAFAGVTTEVSFEARSGFGNTQANGPNFAVQDGDLLFHENTTLSIVFDIRLTDVDLARNFAGGQSQMLIPNVQVDFDDVVFVPNCVADTSAFFFGCGMVIDDQFGEGDTTTSQGGDYDLVSVNLPLTLPQDADGVGGLDQITDTFLELAFSGPIVESESFGTITQEYEVDMIWTGSINPDFGPIDLGGDGVVSAVVPEPGTALLLGGGLMGLACRRRR